MSSGIIPGLLIALILAIACALRLAVELMEARDSLASETSRADNNWERVEALSADRSRWRTRFIANKARLRTTEDALRAAHEDLQTARDQRALMHLERDVYGQMLADTHWLPTIEGHHPEIEIESARDECSPVYDTLASGWRLAVLP